VSISISEQGEALQRKLEALLWEDDDVRDLYRQVLINQASLNESSFGRTGKWWRETAALLCIGNFRKSNQESCAGKDSSEILPGDIPDRDVAILLGEMHVAGKNTWTPFEKAGHVYRMHNDFALVQDEIALRLRMSKSKINQLIRAFDLMKNKYCHSIRGREQSQVQLFRGTFQEASAPRWINSTPGADDLFVEWWERTS